MRRAVTKFSLIMNEALNSDQMCNALKNDPGPLQLIEKTIHKLNALKRLVWKNASQKEVAREAADVANFAMMISRVYVKEE